MSERMIRGLVTGLVLVFLGGCSTVQPWQRGHLAEPDMAWEPDALAAALDDHVYFAKEASSGGTGLGGGGCGCN